MKENGHHTYHRKYSNPGPGRYESSSTLSKKHNYSFRPRTAISANQSFLNPAPNNYLIPGLGKYGKYCESKYKNSKASNFHPKSS